MHPKDADRMANSVDPDQTAPFRSSLVLVCTVCSDLSVPILRILWFCFLQRLWFLLDQYHTPPLVGEDQMINYEDFLKVANEAGVKCQ